MSLTHSQPAGTQDAGVEDDDYLSLEDVARRLDVPLGLLQRRVEVGDIPAQRIVGPDGVGYRIRAADVGLAPFRRPERDGVDNAPDGVDVVGRQAPSSNLPAADPRHELASMSIDPRELVAGLLDRWERTLEQRIYAEHRMRFETELNARQNLVKQLQLELQTSRAQQAAALTERDRRLADTERRAQDLQRELAAAREATTRKRGRLFRR